MRCSIAALAILVASAMAAGPNDDPLVAVWGTQRTFGPQVRGELTIDGRRSPWQASIGGYAVAVRRAGSTIEFTLPGGAGSFRGRMSAQGGSASGMWTQPATVVSGVPYATPLRLRQKPANVWRGDVRPLSDRLSVYLAVSARANGVLQAFIRNPEANVGMGRPFVVSRDGRNVTLTDGDDPHDTIGGTYDSTTDRLALDLPEYGPLVFTRRSRDDALGFYPRTPAVDRWTYRPPIALDDGWRTGPLTGAGIDPAPIWELVNHILTTPTTSFKTPYIQALLVARHDRLVLEEYFYGFDAARTHDLRSAGKSFTGLMAGIAIESGAPLAMNARALEYFPEYASVANPDPRKSRMTVANLLTMSSGLACDDNDDGSPGNEDRMYAQTARTDYYKYALDLPMAAPPGTHTAVYCTIGINLVGGIIRNQTKMPLTDFFERYVAEPLQFGNYHLNLMPNGDAYAGGGLYLRPRDALKLGQLYLDGGLWNGRRIVGANWVAESTREYSAFPASPYAPGHGYGYAWHLFAIRAGDATYREYMAQGNGGQIIAVFPDLDATVLILAGNYGNFPTWRTFYEDLIPRYVVPALAPASKGSSSGFLKRTKLRSHMTA